MKPDLVPWGNWFQSPSSYGFSCWQDWFEGEPKCQQQLPLLRRTLKDVMMIVNRVRTHMHTIFYNKLTDYNWFPQYRTWEWCEEDTGDSLCPIVEETRNLEFTRSLSVSQVSHCTANWSSLKRRRCQLVIYRYKYQVFPVVKGLSYPKTIVTLCALLVYVPLADQSFEYQAWCFKDRKHARKSSILKWLKSWKLCYSILLGNFRIAVLHCWCSYRCFHTLVLHCCVTCYNNTNT